MRIVFFGTPDFGIPCLEQLNIRHTVVACVTQPDRAANRGVILPCAIKQKAIELGIPVFSWEKVKEHLNDLRDLEADIGVTAAYGQILTQGILDSFPHGIINVHGSLLPKYRGAAPIQWAIINGEEKTGITIMQTEKGVDTGDILGVKVVKIKDDEKSLELFERLSRLAPEILLETIEKCERGELCPIKQDETLASHCLMLTKEIGRLDFRKTAKDVYNLFRGTYGWPGATMEINGKIFKVLDCHIEKSFADKSENCGKLLVEDNKLLVKCADDYLCIDVLQEAGKKAMTAMNYLLGHKIA